MGQKPTRNATGFWCISPSTAPSCCDGLTSATSAQTRQADRKVVRGADGKVRPHRESGHSRPLTCVFGTVTVTRTAWRGRSTTSVQPLDADLAFADLPAGRSVPMWSRGRLGALYLDRFLDGIYFFPIYLRL